MAMEEALVGRLRAALGLDAGRVSWFERQRGEGLPAITLNKVYPGRDYSHGGHDGLPGPRVQFDCWGGTAAGAVALSRAVLAEMEQSATVDGVRLTPGQLEMETWAGEDKADGGQRLFRAILDIQFYHEEI